MTLDTTRETGRQRQILSRNAETKISGQSHDFKYFGVSSSWIEHSSLPITSPHPSVYVRINGKVKIFLQIFRGVVERCRRNRNPAHKQDTKEGMEPASAASRELYMGEVSHHTSVHSSLSSMSLLRWKTIFLERDSSSSGAISGSSSHCKSKTFSWL